MSDIAVDFGPAAYENSIEKVVESIIKLLDKEAYCQISKMGGAGEDVEGLGEDDEDEDDEDDDLDHDALIFENAGDLIINLARAFGNEFQPFFNVIGPKLVVYTSDDHPKADKIVAFGTVAEVFANCPASIPPFFDGYVQLLVKNSYMKDSKINRNIAYAIGVLAQHAQLQFEGIC